MPSVSDNQEIYVGNIVTGDNRKNPLVKENTALVVKDGTIVAKECFYKSFMTREIRSYQKRDMSSERRGIA